MAGDPPLYLCSRVTNIPFPSFCSLLMPQVLHRFYGARDLHFLTFSCYWRQPLFSSATRCDLFLQILERVRRRYRLLVLGYVVMPEHVHLLVSEPQRATLSTAIQALKLGFVRSSEINAGSGKAAVPRACPERAEGSRKGSQTWGTPVVPNRFWQAQFYDFNVWTERKRVESFATFIAIRSNAGWWSHPSSGVGAVFVGIVLAKRVRCASTIPIYW